MGQRSDESDKSDLSFLWISITGLSIVYEGKEFKKLWLAEELVEEIRDEPFANPDVVSRPVYSGWKLNKIERTWRVSQLKNTDSEWFFFFEN